MSPWNGFEDGDANSEHSTPLSSPSSPFRTAFRTPRPATAPKTSTGSTSVLPNRMVKSWGTIVARSHSGTLPKRPMLVQAKGRRSPVVVQATVIGALGSVLTRQQGQNIPRLRSYSNRTMVRWRNRILGVVNWVYSVSLVVARSSTQ